MRLRLALAVLAVPAVALAAGKLSWKTTSNEPLRVTFALDVTTTWSSADHKLRRASDTGHIEVTGSLESGAEREGLTPVTLAPRTFHARREKKLDIDGLFSDDHRVARSGCSWKAGDPGGPAPWKLLLARDGSVVADVTSSAALWPLQFYFKEVDDRGSDDDAQLRRLYHHTDLGTLLGSPLLRTGRHELAVPFLASESGLTNKLVSCRAIYDVSSEERAGLIEFTGKVVRVELVSAEPVSDRPIDRWLSIAFKHDKPQASGDLRATFDPAAGIFLDGRASVTVAHGGKFDGGSGRAAFTREVFFRISR